MELPLGLQVSCSSDQGRNVDDASPDVFVLTLGTFERPLPEDLVALRGSSKKKKKKKTNKKTDKHIFTYLFQAVQAALFTPTLTSRSQVFGSSAGLDSRGHRDTEEPGDQNPNPNPG